MSGMLETRESTKVDGECAREIFGIAPMAKEEIAPEMKFRRDREDVGSCITPSLELPIVLTELGGEFFHCGVLEDDLAGLLAF